VIERTMKHERRSSILILGAALALGGCAVTPTAPSVMVLPGTNKSADQFHADSAECQQRAFATVAPVAQDANNQAVASAAIGTAVGAAAGALLGGGYHSHSSAAAGAATGLMFGSAVGGSQSQFASYSLQQRYDITYMQCMYLRGHQIPGQASYRRQAPAAVPAPTQPPPIYSPPRYPPPDTPPPVGPAPPA
jgi:outer membrane lipoprotein SlyB